MPRTSTKETEILSYIQDYIQENQFSPSIRDICRGVGLQSTATVHYHLRSLREKGKISCGTNKNRAISLTQSPTAKSVPIPIVGTVTAGQPILAVEQIDGYTPWDGEENCFALKVRGDSMVNAGIFDGDLVIVRPQSTADHGDIVVALLDDEATVKRLSVTENGIFLMPENEKYVPIDGSSATILGKVRGLTRKF